MASCCWWRSLRRPRSSARPAIPALVAAAAGVTALLYGKTTRTHLLSVAAADGVLRVDWLDGDRACSAQARTPAGAAPGRPASSSGSGPSLDDSRAAMLLSFQRGAGKILQLQLGRQSIEQYTSPDWPTERLERLAAALSAGHR